MDLKESSFSINQHYAWVAFHEKSSRRDIPHKHLWWELMNFLGKRGFDVFKDKRIEKNYKCLSSTHRQGKKGDLEFKSDVYPAGFKIDFFQNIVVENSNGGEYDFDKFDKMPYLIKKSFLNESNHIRLFLEKHKITDDSKSELKSSEGKVFQHICEYRDMHHASDPFSSLEASVGHTSSNCNNEDRDKKQLFNGDVKYFRDHKGNLNRCVVYHHINNMWFGIINKDRYINSGSFEYFDCIPSEVRRKIHPCRKQILEAKKNECISNDLLEKAIIFRDILKTEESG